MMAAGATKKSGKKATKAKNETNVQESTSDGSLTSPSAIDFTESSLLVSPRKENDKDDKEAIKVKSLPVSVEEKNSFPASTAAVNTRPSSFDTQDEVIFFEDRKPNERLVHDKQAVTTLASRSVKFTNRNDGENIDDSDVSGFGSSEIDNATTTNNPLPSSFSDHVTLYVSGLPRSMSEQRFSELFTKWGPLSRCEIMYDPHTGDSRGFGFVGISESKMDEAIKAIDGLVMAGRVIKIEKAKRQKPRSPTPGRYFGTERRDRPIESRDSRYHPNHHSTTKDDGRPQSSYYSRHHSRSPISNRSDYGRDYGRSTGASHHGNYHLTNPALPHHSHHHPPYHHAQYPSYSNSSGTMPIMNFPPPPAIFPPASLTNNISSNNSAPISGPGIPFPPLPHILPNPPSNHNANVNVLPTPPLPPPFGFPFPLPPFFPNSNQFQQQQSSQAPTSHPQGQQQSTSQYNNYNNGFGGHSSSNQQQPYGGSSISNNTSSTNFPFQQNPSPYVTNNYDPFSPSMGTFQNQPSQFNSNLPPASLFAGLASLQNLFPGVGANASSNTNSNNSNPSQHHPKY